MTGAVAVSAGRDVAAPVTVAGLEVVGVADPAFGGDVGEATVPKLA